jgi:hypothetical protein
VGDAIEGMSPGRSGAGTADGRGEKKRRVVVGIGGVEKAGSWP